MGAFPAYATSYVQSAPQFAVPSLHLPTTPRGDQARMSTQTYQQHMQRTLAVLQFHQLVSDIQELTEGGGRENTGGREHVLCNDYFSTMRAATVKRSSSVERVDRVVND